MSFRTTVYEEADIQISDEYNRVFVTNAENIFLVFFCITLHELLHLPLLQRSHEVKAQKDRILLY